MKTRGALPLHSQISELLIREIASGRMSDGEKLPSEREMAANLGVAVRTLRKALADLTAKGLLERVQGSGNYVRTQSDSVGSGPVQSVYSFFRLERVEGGGLPTAKILSVQKLKKPDGLPAFGLSCQAHRCRRLRYLSGVPAALEEIWLDGSAAETLSRADMSESLYLYYKNHLGFWITRVQDQVGLGHVPDWAPPEFGRRPGEACGYVERISWTQSNVSIEFSRTWFDHEKARYVARLK